MIKETLKSLGLNDKEISIYMALLPLGKAPASSLGHRTGITRSTAQYTCQQLAKKGLINSTETNNTFIYSPESPDKLVYLLDQQKTEINEKEEQVNRILSELKGMINPETQLPKIRFFEGVDGLIKMFESFLEEKETIYGAATIDENIHPEILSYIQNEYRIKRETIGNQGWGLLNDNAMTREYVKNDEKMNRVSLLVPLEQFPIKSCTHIYGNKVAFYSYDKNDLTGVIIENELIHKTQFSIFKMAWNYARKLEINKKKKAEEI